MTKKLVSDDKIIVKLLDIRGGVTEKKGGKKSKKPKVDLIKPEIKDQPVSLNILTTEVVKSCNLRLN